MKNQSGIPGAVGIDHVGFTVPDMEEAHEFLTEILGAQFVYQLGPYPAGAETAAKLGISDEAVMEQIRFYRLHTGANLEVFHYSAPDQRLQMPKNSDVGGHHLAIYVEDLDEAIAWLESKSVELMAGPTKSSGPSEGQRWIYFVSPWGMYFELVSFPNGKAYEKDADVMLWDVRCPAE